MLTQRNKTFAEYCLSGLTCIEAYQKAYNRQGKNNQVVSEYCAKLNAKPEMKEYLDRRRKELTGTSTIHDEIKAREGVALGKLDEILASNDPKHYQVILQAVKEILDRQAPKKHVSETKRMNLTIKADELTRRKAILTEKSGE